MKKTRAILVAAISLSMTSTSLAGTSTTLRSAVEAKGGNVSYNGVLKEVRVDYKGSKINFVIGSGKVNVNGNVLNEKTFIENDRTLVDSDFLSNVLMVADAVASIKETKLEYGTVKTYDFGEIKLHAYLTSDALSDLAYFIEKGDNVVIIESAAFNNNVDEFASYIESTGKTVAGALLAYHPNGYDKLGNIDVYATDNAVASWNEGGSIKGLVDGFLFAFGDTVAAEMPKNAKNNTAGESLMER